MPLARFTFKESEKRKKVGKGFEFVIKSTLPDFTRKGKLIFVRKTNIVSYVCSLNKKFSVSFFFF